MTERAGSASLMEAERLAKQDHQSAKARALPWNVIAAMASTGIIDHFRAPPGAPSLRKTRRKRIKETLASDIRNGVVEGQVFLHEGSDKETLIGEVKDRRFIVEENPPLLFDKLRAGSKPS